MTVKNKKMAFDVDGVLLNFMKAFDESASEYLKRPVNPPKDNYGQTPYDIAMRAGCHGSDVDKILDYMLETGKYARFEGLPGAAEALEQIADEGFSRVIVTALPESAAEMRLKNLKNELGFIPDDCYFVGMGKSKSQALLQCQPDVFIDDRVKYLSQGSHIFHLAWCDQSEMQDDREFMVSSRVKSLKEWTEKHLLRISDQLDLRDKLNIPLQNEFNFKNDERYRPTPSSLLKK